MDRARSQEERSSWKSRFLVGVGLGILGGAVAFGHAEEEEEARFSLEQAGLEDPSLPTYGLAEVRQHRSVADGLWVVYRRGVYDLTSFVASHPGGPSKISLAGGGSVEPYWALYQQHLRHPDVAAMLEGMRIGNLAEADAAELAVEIRALADPYAQEPSNRPEPLMVRSQRPFCGEPPLQPLGRQRVTPLDLFYIRNHLPVPLLDAESHRLLIGGLEGGEVLSLTVADLQRRFEAVELEAVVQCGGNRRNELSKVRPTRGGSWEQGAISNARWKGVRLRDVLLWAGVDEHACSTRHVHLEGADGDAEKAYLVSIPLERALDPRADVLLVWEMNGEPLRRDHGHPLRVLVPGVVGARSVKWLRKVQLADEESPGHWQKSDYKTFSPSVGFEDADYAQAMAIQELPVQSAITEPAEGAQIPRPANGLLTVRGYAWSGGGKAIARVDVSPDGGRSWLNAKLSRPNQPEGRVWAWTLWELDVPVPPSATRLDLCARAVDASHNVQPESPEHIWNIRGLLNNSWHRFPVFFV